MSKVICIILTMMMLPCAAVGLVRQNTAAPVDEPTLEETVTPASATEPVFAEEKAVAPVAESAATAEAEEKVVASAVDSAVSVEAEVEDNADLPLEFVSEEEIYERMEDPSETVVTAPDVGGAIELPKIPL